MIVFELSEFHIEIKDDVCLHSQKPTHNESHDWSVIMSYSAQFV